MEDLYIKMYKTITIIIIIIIFFVVCGMKMRYILCKNYIYIFSSLDKDLQQDLYMLILGKKNEESELDIVQNNACT